MQSKYIQHKIQELISQINFFSQENAIFNPILNKIRRNYINDIVEKNE